MRVTVVLPGSLRSTAGGAGRLDLDIGEGSTLGAALDQIGGRHPALDRRLRDERKALRRYVNFYVDGEECRTLAGADTPLADGAEIRVIPSVAGG